MAAVSALGSMVCVLTLRLNSSSSRLRLQISASTDDFPLDHGFLSGFRLTRLL
jgi:hypothetical protein